MNNSPYHEQFVQLAKEVKAMGALTVICVFLTPGKDVDDGHMAQIHIEFAGDKEITHEHIQIALATATKIVQSSPAPKRESFKKHDA